jgi:hypothetical protein
MVQILPGKAEIDIRNEFKKTEASGGSHSTVVFIVGLYLVTSHTDTVAFGCSL